MCTYVTERIAVEGSGKSTLGWVQLSHASVYVDHPYHTPREHTLNIDFLSEASGPSARVAVELSPNSARDLVRSVELALARFGGAASA